ncbi:MAG: tRNA lysidine(34) synthetase TilS [Lachnospiraceae bacterium]
MNADKIEEKVIAYCKSHQMIEPGDHILLGLSGGGDSVCLFYVLLLLKKEIDFSLRAVHVHHGIRKEADQDRLFVENLCRENGILCDTYYENVPAYAEENGLSGEEAGRLLRYQDFRKSLKAWEQQEERKDQQIFDKQEARKDPQTSEQQEARKEGCRFKIATAHHLDDQAETVLFQLFRGSGLTGLCGIRSCREDLIRPLLCISKKEIEYYLQEKEIEYCHDQTNDQDDYARNKIRHHILPFAEQEICQGAAEHIGRTAEILQEADTYIQKQIQTAAKGIMQYHDHGNKIALSISELQKEDIFLQKQILLYAIAAVTGGRKDVGYGHIQSILKLLDKTGNGKLSLPHHIMARKEYDILWIYPESFSNNVSEDRELKFETEILSLDDKEELKHRFSIEDPRRIMEFIPEKTYTKWFDYDRIETGFIMRHRMQGDYLTINEGYARKSLKEYMIEEKIPREQRDSMWVLADGPHIMWVPGYRISTYYKVTKETKRILQVKIKQTEERTCQST